MDIGTWLGRIPDSLRRRGRDLSTQMSKLPAYAEQFVLILLAAACYSFFLPGNRCPLSLAGLCRHVPVTCTEDSDIWFSLFSAFIIFSPALISVYIQGRNPVRKLVWALDHFNY
ncbi:hypothetical protein JB92DRAFT_2864310 [Gautieria morchelliformis]|nr:hypothetical protein JB92DRAFT_2864310 [Gautieria morchelliformis]